MTGTRKLKDIIDRARNADPKNIDRAAQLERELEHFAQSFDARRIAKLFADMNRIGNLMTVQFADPYLNALMSGEFDRLWNYDDRDLIIERRFVLAYDNPQDKNRNHMALQFIVSERQKKQTPRRPRSHRDRRRERPVDTDEPATQPTLPGSQATADLVIDEYPLADD